MKNFLFTVLVSFMILGLFSFVSCSSPLANEELKEDEYEVEYIITGSGIVDIFLVNSSGGTETKQGIILSDTSIKYQYESFDDDFPYISAMLDANGGTVTIELYVFGYKRDSQSSSGAYGYAKACYLR